MADFDEANSERAKPNVPKLPMVVSPRLDGSDDDAASDFAGDDANAARADAGGDRAPSRSLRFAVLAASVASAAALGSFIGALSVSGVNHLWSASADRPNPVLTSALQATKAQLAELAALKTNLDGAARNANNQFGKLVDRLDRVERVQIEAATKVAHVADAVDRLEKKSVVAAAAPAVPETTGSIATSPPPPSAEAKPVDKILPDWIVQDVRGGHALVENSRGGVFTVAAGGLLPGLGRVEGIKRQSGQWVVMTAGGLITEHN